MVAESDTAALDTATAVVDIATAVADTATVEADMPKAEAYTEAPGKTDRTAAEAGCVQAPVASQAEP